MVKEISTTELLGREGSILSFVDCLSCATYLGNFHVFKLFNPYHMTYEVHCVISILGLSKSKLREVW